MPDRHEGKSWRRNGGEHEAPIITGRHESEVHEAIDRLALDGIAMGTPQGLLHGGGT